MNTEDNRINLDNCGMTTRHHDNGSVKVGETLLSDVIPTLDDSVHQYGTRFGVYQGAGSLGYERITSADSGFGRRLLYA